MDSLELKAALAVLGAERPTKYTASGRLLDMAYDECKSAMFSKVARWSSVCVTMDGWKKRSCEQGEPLITVVLLLPDGSSLFWKVCFLLSLIHI